MKAYLFDYGGTIDTGGCHWSEVILRNYVRAGVQVEREAFRHAYVMGERYLDAPGRVLETDTMLDMLVKKIRHQFEVLSEKVLTAEKADVVAQLCYEEARETTAEAAKTLERLANDTPLYVVSNFYGNLRSVLSDFKLLPFFTDIIESATEGVRKPDPELWRRGIVRSGCQPADIMAVGDSFSKDIIPAHSLGCHTTWVKGVEWEPKTHDETIPDRIVSNIRELV